MKQKYERPRVEITKFQMADRIATPVDNSFVVTQYISSETKNSWETLYELDNWEE